LAERLEALVAHNRINIIGASGTGKTTLAKALAHKLDCLQFDSDDYFHIPTNPPYQKQRSPEERKALIERDLSKQSSWVLSGGAAVWEPTPELDFTLVVFLYLAPAIRLERLRVREAKLFGARIQAAGDMALDHKEFMEWTAGYDSGKSAGTNTLLRHESFLVSVRCPALRIDEPMTTEEQVALILGKLK
jgi:adenylate kinase family enzyme